MLEPEAAVIGLVADQQHEAVAILLGGIERAPHQSSTNSPCLEGGFHGQWPEHQGGHVAGLNRCQSHRADQQCADQRRERELIEMRRTLAQARSGAGETTRTESALVQAFDGIGIAWLFGTDGKRELGHERTRMDGGNGAEERVSRVVVAGSRSGS